jgi:hypothetical protein
MTTVTLTEVENVPSEEVAFEEAWVDCDEVAQALVWVEALVLQLFLVHQSVL